jgi:hypothetical protein
MHDRSGIRPPAARGVPTIPPHHATTDSRRAHNDDPILVLRSTITGVPCVERTERVGAGMCGLCGGASFWRDVLYWAMSADPLPAAVTEAAPRVTVQSAEAPFITRESRERHER